MANDNHHSHDQYRQTVIPAGVAARCWYSFEVFDGNISALEAGIGAFPRRLVVNDEWAGLARRVLEQAEELYDD